MNNKLFEVTSEALEKLFEEALRAYESDITEIDDILNQIRSSIGTSKIGLEQYGQLLNETLKTKGQARDRQLKAIAMILQRLKTKEDAAKGTEGQFLGASPEQTLRLIEEAKKKKGKEDV